jgi:hypothetical protein
VIALAAYLLWSALRERDRTIATLHGELEKHARWCCSRCS